MIFLILWLTLNFLSLHYQCNYFSNLYVSSNLFAFCYPFNQIWFLQNLVLILLLKEGKRRRAGSINKKRTDLGIWRMLQKLVLCQGNHFLLSTYAHHALLFLFTFTLANQVSYITLSKKPVRLNTACCHSCAHHRN